MKPAYISIFFILNLIIVGHGKVRAQCAEQDIINLKKVAIVFGEKSYKSFGFLTNPINDANDICDSLRNVGFTVFPYLDVTKAEMEENMDKWYDKLKGYDVALFYFSGHGAEVNGQNYLLPIDANPKSPTDLIYQAFSANQMLERVESNTNLKYSIVILDACRSNPFTKGWSRDFTDKGLKAMSAKGAFIAFAASPGKIALDGNNRNGTYTEGILKYITTPNLTIDEIFTRVNAYVKKSTKGDQAPFKNSSLGSDYCFSVSRSYKAVVKQKNSAYQQPNSELVLSQDEQRLYTIGGGIDGLSVRDAKTLNIIASIKTGSMHQNIVVSKTDDIVFLTDVNRRFITAVNWRKRQIVDSIKIEYPPLSMAFSADSKKMYVGGNLNNKGVISIIDMHSRALTNKIVLGSEISKMVISSDYKRLYASSKSNDKALTILDTKSEKIIGQINDLDIGEAIGITPDNKKIYLGSHDNRTINVIDPISRISQKVLRIPASSFAFTDDSKYMFAIYDDKITMIECASDEPIYEYPVASPPKGLATTSDGQVFAWLPNEQHMFTFPLLDSTKMLNAASDLELKLKRFKEKVKDDKSFDEMRNKIKSHQDSCERMTSYTKMLEQIVTPVINKVVADINSPNFTASPASGINTNCGAKIADFQSGIHSTFSQDGTINPNFRTHFLPQSIVFTITDNKIDKVAETFNIPLSTIKGSEVRTDSKSDSVGLVLDPDVETALKKITREYFLKRLENLTK